MAWPSAEESAALEAAVKDAEARTGAELVVVLRGRAEPYRDVTFGAAMLVSVVALAFILYHPREFNMHAIVPDMVVAGLLGGLVAARLTRVTRWLTTAARRQEAAQRAAKVAFVDHAVGCTRDRTGILVHYAALERELTILPDAGILGRVPPARFHAIVAQFARDRETAELAQALAHAIRAVGPAVEAEFPRGAGDANELPDRPRVEP